MNNNCFSENRLSYTRTECQQLEKLLKSIANFLKHLEDSEYAETAMEYEASIEKALEGE